MSDIKRSSSAGIDKEISQTKIYPRMVTGKFSVFRVSAASVLLGLFYLVPWLQWDDRQAVLFDLPARKFYIFELILWPQDFIYLTALLILAAVSLFFFTALFGRAWCGYACPQTVWTESFLWIERKIEGDRQQQIKLDKLPWRKKIVKKSTKHALWISFSLFTGFTFVGYFTPIIELAQKFAAFTPGSWETFWVFFYGFATYGNAGWLRESICLYMCPYARFQSAMFDSDTLIISYDKKRGEPRGSRKKGADLSQLNVGSCIDCSLCVQVCPTGIDIRDGLQYECISCSACVDVCDSVMDKMQYPKGLIKYTTENALDGKPSHFLRPRVFMYAFVMLVLIGSFVISLANRHEVTLDVLRDRNSLFRETSDGHIENIYTLKVVNKAERSHEFDIQVSGIDGIQLFMDDDDTTAEPGEVIDIIVRLSAQPEALLEKSSPVIFTVNALDDPKVSATEKARFLGPDSQ